MIFFFLSQVLFKILNGNECKFCREAFRLQEASSRNWSECGLSCYLVTVGIKLLAAGHQQLHTVQQSQRLQSLAPVPAVLVDGVQGRLDEVENSLLGVVSNHQDGGEEGWEELSQPGVVASREV